MSNNRYQIFIKNISQDFLLFFFFLLILSAYRFSFIVLFQNQLDSLFSKDVFLTLWYGLRISLKTAGAFCLPSFIFCTLFNQIFLSYKATKIRFIYGAFCVFVLSILFQCRLPYYQEFNVAFSPFIFNTFNDDVNAITATAIQQYGAIWRIFLGILFSAILTYLLYFWLKLSSIITNLFMKVKSPFIVVIIFFILLFPLALFIRFGGSFNYKHSIYWKNSARMSNNLLNEAILDDIQALYKANKIYEELKEYSANITPDEVRESIKFLTNKDYQEDSLLPFLTQKSNGAKIEKPKHIFVIVGETYMLWPLLEKYKNMTIAKGVRRLLSTYDNILLTKFLPSSNGTMFGLTSVLLGLPELSLTTASRETAQKPYEIALSTQLKSIGYKTRFFYGGFASWENVGQFMNNQNIDESFYYSDFSSEGNVWGVSDKDLFEGILSRITEEPSFNLILTSSNHPPYTLDMSKEENVSKKETLAEFLQNQSDKDLMLQKMQNFEYADWYLSTFVDKIMAKYPDSLIVITGDHADRWTLNNTPTLQERIGVPLILIAKGLNQNMLSSNVAGSHQDIPATILDLILPKDTSYYALGKSVFSGQDIGLHAYYWCNSDFIGETNSSNYESLSNTNQTLTNEEQIKIKDKVKAYQKIASWRILKGLDLSK